METEQREILQFSRDCQEKVMADHHEAMAFCGFEDIMRIGNDIFRRFVEHLDEIQRDVFYGAETASKNNDKKRRTGLRIWIFATELLIEVYSKYFNEYDGKEFEKGAASLAQAKKLLDNWSSPTISKAIGLREIPLSKKSWDELNRIRALGPTAVPKGTVPPVKELSQEEFFKLVG